MVRALKTAYIHTPTSGIPYFVYGTQGHKLLITPPPASERPAETLLGRDLKYDESSPRLACDCYSLTAVPEALTMSMLPPCPTWMDS
jgi:hypothetical protein